MTYLIDTNVLSEFMRPEPNAHVLAWWEVAEETGLFYVSAISIAEIQNGICRLPIASQRRKRLEKWLKEDVVEAFSDRIIPFGTEEAQMWGEITAAEEEKGTCKPDLDMQIAATALVHGLTLVTRNVADFDNPKLRVLNPFGD